MYINNTNVQGATYLQSDSMMFWQQAKLKDAVTVVARTLPETVPSPVFLSMPPRHVLKDLLMFAI